MKPKREGPGAAAPDPSAREAFPAIATERIQAKRLSRKHFSPPRRRATTTGSQLRSHLVFEGRELLGAVSRKSDAYVAIDKNGKRLGRFPNLAEACHAVRSEPRQARGAP